MSGKSRVLSAAFSAAPLLDVLAAADASAFGTTPYIAESASGETACKNAVSAREQR